MKKGVSVVLLLVVLSMVTYAIEDVQKPVAEILVPAEGQVISGEFVVRAKATDNIEVQRVEFLLDGYPMFTDTIPTAEGVYQWLWDSRTAENGQHEIIVAPYDDAGNFDDLTRRTATVNNAAQPVQTVPQVPLTQTPSVQQAPAQQPAAQPKALPRSEDVIQVEEAIAAAEGGVEEKTLWPSLLVSVVVIVVVGGLLAVVLVRRRSPYFP